MSSLFIPVILGTARKGRRSENAARFVFEETKKRAVVETEFVDICNIPMRLDDAGEQMKDPAFSDLVTRADGLILVVPEYNHGYPGLLKHALDMNLKEYIHKAVGICGVSAGSFGGARVIEALLPVMRELGLVTIFNDVNFGPVGKIFGEDGKLLDEKFVRRTAEFLDELIWMARVFSGERTRLACCRWRLANDFLSLNRGRISARRRKSEPDWHSTRGRVRSQNPNREP